MTGVDHHDKPHDDSDGSSDDHPGRRPPRRRRQPHLRQPPRPRPPPTPTTTTPEDRLACAPAPSPRGQPIAAGHYHGVHFTAALSGATSDAARAGDLHGLLRRRHTGSRTQRPPAARRRSRTASSRALERPVVQQPGTFYWEARYTGDAGNNPAPSPAHSSSRPPAPRPLCARFCGPGASRRSRARSSMRAPCCAPFSPAIDGGARRHDQGLVQRRAPPLTLGVRQVVVKTSKNKSITY